MNALVRVAAILTLVLTFGAGGSQHAAAADQSGAAAYLEGLEALEAARADEAIESLSMAIDADPESADYYTARGVAYALAERLPQAASDLKRSLRLRPNHETSRMWMAVVVAMTGDIFADTQIFPAATTDQQQTYLRTASREYGELDFRKKLGETDLRQYEALRVAARKKIAESAALFASNAKNVPGLSGSLTSRGRELFERGDYEQAFDALGHALEGAPEDPELLYYHAASALRLGNARLAREELTRTLTFKTDYGVAYLERAEASARLGALRRARADLEIAGRLAPAETARRRHNIEKLIAASTTTANALAALESAIRQNQSFETCVDAALDVHYATNAAAPHYDEWYQDRLRVLEDAVRREPRNPDRLAALAHFLYSEASVRRERVEPRGPYRMLRWQTPQGQDREVARAEELADQALAIAPNHVDALVVKASARIWNYQFADGEALVRQALKLNPRGPEVLELLAEVLEVAAAQRTAKAMDLRRPKYAGSSQETVGDWVYTYTYYRYPSREEIEEAQRLESQAAELVKLALDQIAAAAKASEGTPQGSYFWGVWHWRQDNLPEARRYYEEAIRGDSKQPRWHFNLAGILKALGEDDAAFEARLAGMNLLEPTAAPLLEQTWGHVVSTRWKTGRTILHRAGKLDPADARVWAYLGVINEADERPEDAVAYYRMALVIEEARLRLQGNTLTDEGQRPLSPEDIGLTIALRQRLAGLALAAGDAKQAAELHLSTLGMADRIPREHYSTDVTTAMLPRADLEPQVVPEADNVLALLAWAHVGAGESLYHLRRYEDAIKVLAPIDSFEGLLINGLGSTRLRGPQLYSHLWRARSYLELGDLRHAQQHAQMLPRKRHGAGPSKGPFPELEEQGSALQEEIARRMRGARAVGDESSNEYMPPDEDEVRAALKKIGEAIGHPELGGNSRRYTGDVVEIQLCVLVDQAVRMIVIPKSTRWREQTVMSIQMVEASRTEVERRIEFYRQRAETAAQSGRPERGSNSKAELAAIEAVVEKIDTAISELKKLAIERGYPKAELERDIERSPLSRSARPPR